MWNNNVKMAMIVIYFLIAYTWAPYKISWAELMIFPDIWKYLLIYINKSQRNFALDRYVKVPDYNLETTNKYYLKPLQDIYFTACSSHSDCEAGYLKIRLASFKQLQYERAEYSVTSLWG